MDTSNPEAIEAVSSRKALSPLKRQHRSPELKRQIVEETLAPGYPSGEPTFRSGSPRLIIP